jgi:hypothetical protein
MGDDPFPMWAVNKHAGLRKWVQCHLPHVLGKGKACSSGILPRKTLSKQSLWGQVSAKLTPEVCINKASSNSWLTAVGRQATASDSHSQNCLQTLFFFPFFFLWWDNNQTTPACWKTYWNCIAFELGTLCGVFCCCCYCFLLPFEETMKHHLQDWRLRDEHQNYYDWNFIAFELGDF